MGAIAGAWQALGAEDAKPDPSDKIAAREGREDAPDNDPYLWLAKIHGEKALDWVKMQNAKSDAVLKSDPNYGKIRASHPGRC